MAKMGFGAIRDSKRESDRELKNVKDVQTMLREEIMDCQQCEQALIQEFRAVRDLERNLAVVEKQMGFIRRLADEKDKIATRLFTEQGKNKDQGRYWKMQRVF